MSGFQSKIFAVSLLLGLFPVLFVAPSKAAPSVPIIPRSTFQRSKLIVITFLTCAQTGSETFVTDRKPEGYDCFNVDFESGSKVMIEPPNTKLLVFDQSNCQGKVATFYGARNSHTTPFKVESFKVAN